MHGTHRTLRRAIPLIVAAALLASIALLYARAAAAYRHDPRPTHDLAAELNAPWAAVPPSQRAAPAYARLHDAWRAANPPPADDPYRDLRTVAPHDPDFTALADLVRTLEPELAAARAAATLETLGADFARPTPEDLSLYDPIPTDPVMLESAVFLRIPGMGHASNATALLLIDADHAAIHGDADRFADNVHASLAIARQVRQVPVFIADIIALRAVEQSAKRIRRVLADHPNLLDEPALAALQADLAETARHHTTLRVEHELRTLSDTLDRTFSPGPRGRLTKVGLRRLDTIHHGNELFRETIPDENAPMAPLLAATLGTRAEHLAWHRDLIDRAAEARDAGPAGAAAYISVESQRLFSDDSDAPALARTLFPALGSALYSQHVVRLEAEATLVAIALHRYRLTHGTYPPSLHPLVPALLDALPVDPFDPISNPIKYRLTSAGPTLYYNGANRRDDNATPPVPDPMSPYAADAVRSFNTLAPGQSWPNAPAADWVIYPDPPADAPAPADPDA